MGVCLAALAAGAACGWPGTTTVGNAPAGHATAARTNAASQPAAHGEVWVIATVPVQLHSTADMNSARVTLLSWGQHLTVTGSQKVGADTFLEVKTDGGTQGWVVDRPDLVIHRSVSQKIAQTFQILYPSEWNVSGDNPVIFASPSSDPEGINMLVQTAAAAAQLPQVPLRQGQAIGDDSVQVGNPTYVLHSFKLNQGGFESDVSFMSGATAYLFDFRQAKGSKPDTTLFETLLGSAIINGG